MIDFMERMGIDPEDFSWQELGLCAGLGAADPALAEIFHSKADASQNFKAQAKAICDVCPVKDICLEEGIRNKEYGIWGGERLTGGKKDD